MKKKEILLLILKELQKNNATIISSTGSNWNGIIYPYGWNSSEGKMTGAAEELEYLLMADKTPKDTFVKSDSPWANDRLQQQLDHVVDC